LRRINRQESGMSRPVVAVTDFVREPLDRERAILGDAADVIALDAMSEAELDERLETASAIMLYHFITLSRGTIERLRKCRLIVRCGVGFDNVDRDAAREKGIPVANVPDYGSEEVADSAIGMMLSLTRGIHLYNQRLLRGQGEWIYTQAQPLHRLRGRTLGLVGVGRIGTATALRGKALGMRVLYYDPYAPDGRDKALGIERAERLEDLLGQSDVVSLHCPRTEETRLLINEHSIGQMKRGAYLVNTARGTVVDGSAVLAAIESGHLAGAGLDVLEVEPPPDDDPLIVAWRDPAHPAHDRVLINPHAAFYSEEGLDDMRIKGSQNCLRVLRGEAPRNVVN
jgi:D-3-phosphoglycerate dehydrogenase/C-terminal binding protein